MNDESSVSRWEELDADGVTDQFRPAYSRFVDSYRGRRGQIATLCGRRRRQIEQQPHRRSGTRNPLAAWREMTERE